MCWRVPGAVCPPSLAGAVPADKASCRHGRSHAGAVCYQVPRAPGSRVRPRRRLCAIPILRSPWRLSPAIWRLILGWSGGGLGSCPLLPACVHPPPAGIGTLWGILGFCLPLGPHLLWRLSQPMMTQPPLCFVGLSHPAMTRLIPLPPHWGSNSPMTTQPPRPLRGGSSHPGTTQPPPPLLGGPTRSFSPLRRPRVPPPPTPLRGDQGQLRKPRGPYSFPQLPRGMHSLIPGGHPFSRHSVFVPHGGFASPPCWPSRRGISRRRSRRPSCPLVVHAPLFLACPLAMMSAGRVPPHPPPTPCPRPRFLHLPQKYHPVHCHPVFLHLHALADGPVVDQVECRVQLQHRSNISRARLLGRLNVETVPNPP